MPANPCGRSDDGLAAALLPAGRAFFPAGQDPDDLGRSDLIPQASDRGSACPAVPDHEMLRSIGRGSYGEVWLARSTVGTLRAVKVVRRDRFQDSRPYEREYGGIQKYEPISRTNEGLVDVLQIGRNDAEGYFYYVMELADDANPPIAGDDAKRLSSRADPDPMGRPDQRFLTSSRAYIPKTLAGEIRRRGRLPIDECITLGLNLNLALAHLHRHGLIHRDIKPSNIIFVNGVPKLADIGLVTDAADAQSFVGTEGFIPPEGPNTRGADIYAMGKVLYEASMGKDRHEFPEPFTGLGLDAESRSLMEFNTVVLKACEPVFKERYLTAEEMNVDLALLHSGQSVRNKRRLEHRLKLFRRVAMVTVAVMVLGMLPYCLAIKEARRARAAEADATEKLWHSYINEAQARRWSGRVGRRFEALDSIRKAVAIRPSIDLRNEAIACLALSDLRKLKSLGPNGDDLMISQNFDDAYSLYGLMNPDGLVRIRRVEDGAELLRLPDLKPPRPGYSDDLGFSPDGHFFVVAAGAETKGTEIWDLNKKQLLKRFDELQCRTMAFSPDNRRVAISFMDEAHSRFPLMIYDLLESRVLNVFEAGCLPYSLRFNPSKNQLAVSSWSSTNVQIWDLEASAVVTRLPHPSPVMGIDWRPDGQQLATACCDANLYLWDFTDSAPSEVRHVLSGHGDKVNSVEFTFDGAFLCSRSQDDSLRIWDDISHETVLAMPDSALFGMRASGTNGSKDYRLIWNAGRGGAGILEFAPGRVCKVLQPSSSPTGSGARSVRFSHDGKCLLIAHDDGIRVWDLAREKTVVFQRENQLATAQFEPGFDRFVTSEDSGIKEWDYCGDSNRVESTVAFSRLLAPVGGVRWPAISPNGQFLAYFLKGGVHVQSLLTGDDAVSSKYGALWPYLAFSPDGKLAVCEAQHDTAAKPSQTRVRIIDPSGAIVLKDLRSDGARRMFYSPNGRWLAVEHMDTFDFWDTLAWQVRFAVPKISNSTDDSLSFSPDSSFAALVVDRDKIRLVETSSGRELATLHGPEMQWIRDLDFSRAGDRLAVALDSGQIEVWDLPLLRAGLAQINLDWQTPRLLAPVEAHEATKNGADAHQASIIARQ